MNRKVKKVSDDLIVVCIIHEYNLLKKPIWYTKIVELLAGKIEKHIVSDSLDTLMDWGIAFGEYGPLGDGRAGKCWYIDSAARPIIENIHKIWKAGEVDEQI